MDKTNAIEVRNMSKQFKVEYDKANTLKTKLIFWNRKKPEFHQVLNNINLNMKTIKDFDFKNKKALVRVDFNVPQDENLNVTDNTRIVAVKPTVDKILADGGSVILMTHLGRPKGEVNDKYSLKHILSEVSKVLGQDVKFVEESVGEKAEQAAAELQAGEILLLENLRFHKEEEKGDEQFEISDGRSVDEIYQMIEDNGMQPVMTDYIYV